MRSKKTLGLLILLLPSILLWQRCKSGVGGEKTSVDIQEVPDSLVEEKDSIPSREAVKLQGEGLRVGMSVFYRRSGGGGFSRFGELQNGDTIHYSRRDGIMTSRIYQVTHNRRQFDSLESVSISLFRKGLPLRTSKVNFRILKESGYPAITFNDGAPEQAEDMVQISFDFVDRLTKTKHPLIIYMMLDKELKSLE